MFVFIYFINFLKYKSLTKNYLRQKSKHSNIGKCTKRCEKYLLLKNK